MSLYDTLLDQYSSNEDYNGEKFVCMEFLRREFNHQRISRWSKQHPLCRPYQRSIAERDLIDSIVSGWRLLFALLVLAQMEDLFLTLTVHGLRDDTLFDVKSFHESCDSAALTPQEKDTLIKHRRLVGAMLHNHGHQVFPKSITLPYRSVNHPKDDRFGAFGVVRRVKIAAGHLKENEQMSVTGSKSKGFIDRV